MEADEWHSRLEAAQDQAHSYPVTAVDAGHTKGGAEYTQNGTRVRS